MYFNKTIMQVFIYVGIIKKSFKSDHKEFFQMWCDINDISPPSNERTVSSKLQKVIPVDFVPEIFG